MVTCGESRLFLSCGEEGPKDGSLDRRGPIIIIIYCTVDTDLDESLLLFQEWGGTDEEKLGG